MANQAVVGVLRAILSLDSTQFEGGIKRSVAASHQGEKAIEGLGKSVQKLTPQAERMLKAFGGEKLLYTANSLTQAVTKLGGAQKLTEAEQSRVNRTLTDAIAKYKALGQEAPKAMVDLAAMTKKAEQTTAGFFASFRAGLSGPLAGAGLAGAIGGFAGAAALRAVQGLASGLADVVTNGNKLIQVSRSFEQLTRSIDQSASAMLNASRGATKGLVSDLDLMLSTNKAILLGLPVTAKEMATLARTAVTLGKAMGLDATTALDNLVTALGRSSPLILDNLGLTVKLGEANDKYAASLGKSANDLTDAEKKMAFYNAAMEAAQKKADDLGDITVTVTEEFNRLTTATGNVITKFGAGANEAGIFSRALGSMADAAADAARNMDLVAQAQARLEAKGAGAQPDSLLKRLLLLRIRPNDQISSAELEKEIDKILQEELDKALRESGNPLQLPTPTLGPAVTGGALNPWASAEQLIRETDELRQKLEQAAQAAEQLQRQWFSRDQMQAATDAVKTIGNVANVSQLTADKQRDLVRVLEAGIEAWRATGAAVPAAVKQMLMAAKLLPQFTKELEDLHAVTGNFLPPAPAIDAELDTLKRIGDEYERIDRAAAEFRGFQNWIGEREMEDAGKRLDALKQRIVEIRELVQGIFAPAVGAIPDALGALIFGNGQENPRKLRGHVSAEELTRAMRDFESKWESFWKRLGRGAIDTFKNILQMFVDQFLGGMIRALAGSAFGQAFGNWLARSLGLAGGVFGGGVTQMAGGALLPALGIGAGSALPGAAAAPSVASLLGASPAAAGAGAGGAGAAAGLSGVALASVLAAPIALATFGLLDSGGIGGRLRMEAWLRGDRTGIGASDFLGRINRDTFLAVANRPMPGFSQPTMPAMPSPVGLSRSSGDARPAVVNHNFSPIVHIEGVLDRGSVEQVFNDHLIGLHKRALMVNRDNLASDTKRWTRD